MSSTVQKVNVPRKALAYHMIIDKKTHMYVQVWDTQANTAITLQ